MNFIEIIGYTASLIIALSMTQSSIAKFRWINLAGATLFSIYGFVLKAYPVGVMNGFIAIVDLYYLKKIYFKKDIFDILEIGKDYLYLNKFLNYHQSDIEKHIPGFSFKPELNTISFFVLRNTVVAGIFLAHQAGENVVQVSLDYAVPEFRDFKSGKFVYQSIQKSLVEKGITKIIAEGKTKKHIQYLKKFGFTRAENNTFEKFL